MSKLKIEHLVPGNGTKNLMERFCLLVLNTASARSFDVALEGRPTGTGGSYGFGTSKRIGKKFVDLWVI